MIGEAIKQAALDIWDELLYLLLFNVLWFLGFLLVIPLPLVTFGLFFIIYDITEGKSIKISVFFNHARRMWKQAYIWGGVNLVVFVVLWFNLLFYSNIDAAWAAILQLFILALSAFWIIAQLVALPLYPHLEEPGLKIAYRNAIVLMGRYPLAIFALLIFIILLGLLAWIFPAAIFLLAFVAIAVLSSRMVKIMVREELKRIPS